MKKILSFCICFFLLSSSCFATGLDSGYVEYPKVEKKISTDFSKVGTSYVDPPYTGNTVYDGLNSLMKCYRGFFAYTGDALLRAKAWWKEFLGTNNTPATDEEVANYVNQNVIFNETTNNISVSNSLNSAMFDFGRYLMTGLEYNAVQYNMIDIFGKNLKVGNVSSSVMADMAWVYEVCKKYQDDYYISLPIYIYEKSYEQQFFFYCSGVGNKPYLRLEPKNNGYLNSQIFYNQPNTNYLYDCISLSGNNGLNNGNVGYNFYRVNDDLSLTMNYGSTTASPGRSLFCLGVLHTSADRNGAFGYTDPFVGTNDNINSPRFMSIPICYQKKDCINVYHNGYNGSDSGFIYTSDYSYGDITTTSYENCPTYTDCQNYENFRDAINGNNNSVTNGDMINYINNIYPNGNNYYTDPNPPGDNGGGGSGGGLFNSLVNALGGIGTLIGSILSGILQAILNIVGAVVGWISSLVNIFTSLIPQSFGSFMNVFYDLIPEPIMNGIIALFSLTCVMAVIRIIRK